MSEVVVTEHQEHVIKKKAYPEYMKSVLPGENIIPSHWRVVKAKRLFEFVTSGSRGWAEYYSDEGDLFFRITNLTRDSINPKLLSIKNVTPPKGAEGERSRIKDGDLLISITADLGSVCVANDQICGGYVSQHVALCRPCRDIGNFRWLGYVVVSNGTKEQLLGAGYGGTKVQLSLEDLKEFLVPVPPVEERNFIAAFLDYETARIDRLIAQQQRLIELLKEKRQAVISHAVTKGLNPNAPMKDSGVEWLGQVPEHWSVGRYKFCNSRIIVGIAEAATHAYVDHGVPLIRSTNIKESGLDCSDVLYLDPAFAAQNFTKKLRAKDIITVRTGYPGVSAVLPSELDNSQCFTNLVATPLPQQESDFLCEYLNSAVGKSYFDLNAWGSAQKNISVPILQDFPVAWPSKVEQLEIVSFCKKTKQKYNRLIDNAMKGIDLLQERRTALISAAVTGKIDLRGWTPPAEEAAT